MPYTMNNKPDIIKNLPVKAQKIFIAAFNTNLEETKNEKQSFKIAWAAVEKAGYKKGPDGIWKRWE